jgi:glycosyltransferase involved in cell wall biosynthesis
MIRKIINKIVRNLKQHKRDITVIMPCHLGEYEGGAKDRAIKLNRAIQSFLRQDYENKKLIIIADGCHTTLDFVSKNGYEKEQNNIKVFFIQKQLLFSGMVRDFGLKVTDTDYITYLDSDDYYENIDHLSIIVNELNSNYDWVYFDDFVKCSKSEYARLIQRNAQMQHGFIGTSNIAHKRLDNITWEGKNGYGHDFNFITELKQNYSNFKKIEGCSYVVCHIPNKVDV